MSRFDPICYKALVKSKRPSSVIKSAPVIESAVCRILLILVFFINKFIKLFFTRIVNIPIIEMVDAIPRAMKNVLIIPRDRIPRDIENSSTITAPVQGVKPTAMANGIMDLFVMAF